MTLDLHHHTKIAQPIAWRMPLKDGTRDSCPVCLQQGRGEQTAAHCRFSRYKIVQSRSKQRSTSTHSMIHPKHSQDQTRCTDSSSNRTHAPHAPASLLILTPQREWYTGLICLINFVLDLKYDLIKAHFC